MAFSLSAKRRLGGPNRLEPPTAFTSGTNAPTEGQVIELRVDESQLNKLSGGQARMLIEQVVQELRRRMMNGELVFGGPN
jgi:hypothetical protein